MAAVERAELHVTDMELLAGLLREQYVGHVASFRCADPASVSGQLALATAGGLTAGKVGYDGFEYTAHVEPGSAPMTVVVVQGTVSIRTRTQERRFAAGDVFMMPADQPSLGHTTTGVEYVTLQIPWAALSALAAEGAGIPAGYLRFESAAPVSAARQRGCAATAAYIYDRLLISGSTELHPLVIQAMTGLAAAAMLETFPNNTMTVPYLPGPGWITPGSVRRAAAFIYEHAGQPTTVTQAAAEAGLTPRALRYAFRRRYNITPAQYQRQVRLERAHLDLLHAEPGDGVTVASVARKWGWASPSRFAAAYRQRFNAQPSHTLRT